MPKNTNKYINKTHPGSKPHLFKRFVLWMAIACLSVLTFCAIFSNILANKNPIYLHYQGVHYFPAFQEQIYLSDRWQKTDRVAWDTLQASSIIWPLINYNLDQYPNHTRLAPLTIPSQTKNGKEVSIGDRHWLGTTIGGIDVLASIIYGARRSLGISIFAILIIALIGIPLGGIAAYFQDDKLQISRASAWLFVPGILLGWFYGFHVRTFQLTQAGESPGSFLFQMMISVGIFGVVFLGFLSLSRFFPKKEFFQIAVPVKIDSLISRFMEIIQSLPGLLLIITLSAFMGSKNIWVVMFILACVSWISIARVVRAEVLSVKEREYILAARASGVPNWRIITHHILPNSLSSIWPMLAFGIGNIILAESALSFLSLIDGHEASWGGLVNAGRVNWKMWWISFFPGVCIFLTVYSFNILGERIRDMLDPYSQ